MNNKGFSLVELVAVIVISIAVPNVISTSKNVKTEMYCNKVKLILDAAKLYGEDSYELIDNNSLSTIKIIDLVNSNYLNKEDKNCNGSSVTCIKDPRDSSSMDNKVINLSIENKRVVAIFNYNNNTDKTTCES